MEFLKLLLCEKLINFVFINSTEKTLNLMFAGARNQSKNSKSCEEDNSMKVEDSDTVNDTVDDKLEVSSVGCKLCLNGTFTHIFCVNCNLRTCERCADQCACCEKNLCVNCITLFGCNIDNENSNITAMCEDCKLFLD